MAQKVLNKFFEKYIKGTVEKATVVNRKIFLCNLTNAVCTGIKINKKTKKVYITTRAVKHLFDKKPAEEFLFLIENLHKVVKYPDKIYKNKPGKRGEHCLVKKIGNVSYLCSIEIILSSEHNQEIQIATVFRLRDDSYIKKYTLLWSWGDDIPHRSALDTLKGTTRTPQ